MTSYLFVLEQKKKNQMPTKSEFYKNNLNNNYTKSYFMSKIIS